MKPRGAAAPASQDEATLSQAEGANSPDSTDEESTGGSTYLVPGLERGLRILAEFSAREPILGAPELSKRIGIPREYRMDGMSPEIDALWKQGAEMLRDAGAEIVDISLPHTKYALPAYYIVAPAEVDPVQRGECIDGLGR